MGLKVFGVGHQAPDQMACRDHQRLPDIDDGVRHDNAFLADGQPGVRSPPQKTVEANEYIFTQIRLNDLGTMGGDVEPFQPRVDDVALLLRVGPLAEPCILKIGALGHQDIFIDMGLGFNH